MIDLTGQTLLVAGSSRGIGAATARLGARLGADIVLHGRTMSPPLAALCKELKANAITCDGRDAAAVGHAVRELADCGTRVDSLICTLGAVDPGPVMQPGEEIWLEQYRANLLATVNFIQAVAPGMRERDAGRIVTVSSIRGNDNLASPTVAPYGAAKAALENVTVSFAKVLAPTITVNCVSPGFVLTDMSEAWTNAVREETTRNLLRRPARPAEIANVLVFLASAAASFITGQTVLVDGGLLMRDVLQP